MVEKVLDKIHDLRNQEGQEFDMFRDPPDRYDVLERMLFHADVLWLGMDNTRSPSTHRRQVIAAQLHYLDDAPIDEIIQLLAPPACNAWLTRSTVEEWLRREDVIRALAYNEILLTSSRLPLIDPMDNLVARLAPALGAEQVGKILGSPGLWRRLVFQYHYLENLTASDICRRLQAAAHKRGYDITTGKLNAWFRDKRLMIRLVRSMATDVQ